MQVIPFSLFACKTNADFADACLLQKQVAGLLQHVKSSKLRKDSFAELLLKTTDVKTGESKPAQTRMTYPHHIYRYANWCMIYSKQLYCREATE